VLFNQTSIQKDYVKVRWGEPRVSSGLNQKNFGVWPDGCYEGFTIGPGGLGPRDIIVGPGSVSGNVSPSVSGVGYLNGNFDAALGYSIAVVNDFQGFSNTVQVPPGVSAIQHLDATGLEGQTVYIILKVEYSINVETTAELALVDGAYIDANPWVVVLGNVMVPASSLTPLDGSMFQYADPLYPRKTPLATPTKAGLMPPSVWSTLQQNMPWQNLLVMDIDQNNAFNFTITPSQFTANGKRLYTYVQQNVSSKFPRNAFGHYNGGINNTQLTVLNMLNGTIGGAHQVSGNLTFPIASVSGVANSYQVGIVSLAPDDTINVVYGGVFSSVSGATFDENIPIPDRTNLQIGGFIISTDGLGHINPLTNVNVPFPILWRRPYLNTGIGNGVQPNFVQEIPSGVVNGTNTTFGLSQVPLNAQSILPIVDGGPLDSTQWTLSGQNVVMLTPPAIGLSVYIFYVSAGQSMVSGAQEIPGGVVDGVNTTFSLSGQVANRASTLVMVNGRVKDGSLWNLIQGLNNSTIQFVTAPALGSRIYVFYLANIFTGNGPSGGGGSGALTPNGSVGTPVAITPSAGISITTDQRQVQYVVGAIAGGNIVTANPQIQAGNAIAQELILFGTSDANYPILEDGDGLALNGPMNLTNHALIYLIWDGTVWAEVSRR